MSKGYWLKIRLTPEQRELIENIWGPKNHVSTNIRAALLRSDARFNPDQFAAIIRALNGIEALLEECLTQIKIAQTDSIPEFLEACDSAQLLLQEARQYAT